MASSRPEQEPLYGHAAQRIPRFHPLAPLLLSSEPSLRALQQNSRQPNGRHTLCCKNGGGINARHNAVRNELHNMALAAGHAAALEVGDGNGKRRPGDVVIKDNNPTTFVAVIHPLQPKYQKQAADNKKLHVRPVNDY
eukprot:PhF_6_TR39724/c1_g4_i1/m.59148